MFSIGNFFKDAESVLKSPFTGADSAASAAKAQQQSAQMGIDEQRRQFDAMQALQQPYVNAGIPALQQQQNFLGLNGAPAQQQFIDSISNSPQFQALQQQGEMGILQNASATGGLRGGNTQGALAQFRPQLLSSLIDQQYNRLGGMTTLGQNAATGVGNQGMNLANNLGNLYAGQGAAKAGGILGQQAANEKLFNQGAQLAGMASGGGFGGFGGGSAIPPPSTNFQPYQMSPYGLNGGMGQF